MLQKGQRSGSAQKQEENVSGPKEVFIFVQGEEIISTARSALIQIKIKLRITGKQSDHHTVSGIVKPAAKNELISSHRIIIQTFYYMCWIIFSLSHDKSCVKRCVPSEIFAYFICLFFFSQ